MLGLQAIQLDGDIIFVVPCPKQQHWHGDNLGVSLSHTLGHPISDGGGGQLQKAGNDGTVGGDLLIMRCQLHKGLATLLISRAMTNQQ